EGTVTNVTNFGAFVDVGVHQDGLVHISAMANSFVKDPREVVKTGAIVKVKIMSVDLKRKRIALSMRLDDTAAEHEANDGKMPRSGKPNQEEPIPKKPQRRSDSPQEKKDSRVQPQPNAAFALAFAQAKVKKTG
ncbi:MAG: hypothetical protein ACI915_005296, partial [Gammaproteobacteria bacterium]